MRVLVLGGTGTIGAPVVRELIRAGHEVLALARSGVSAQKVEGYGAVPLAGDIAAPERWIPSLPSLNAVVHAAAGFTSDDARVERRLLETLLASLSAPSRAIRFIYTGGCWLFGSGGDSATTEETPFDPLPAFAYSVSHIRLVMETPGIHPVVIHPAMVYEPGGGGVFQRFRDDAVTRDSVRVVGSERVRWPLVNSHDLAVLYRLALERAAPGESFIGSAIDAMPVGRIARAFAKRFGTRSAEPEVISEDLIVTELGDWARGYGRDQRQSGARARQVLGWAPLHLDPEKEIATLP